MSGAGIRPDTYDNHSDHPMGVVTSYVRKDENAPFTRQDLFDRIEILARDYSSLFDDAKLPDSYHEEFAPPADLIHRKVEPETLEHLEETTQSTNYAVRLLSSTNKMDDESVKILKESDFYTCVNPVDMERTLNDQRFTNRFLRDYGLPSIPTADVAEAITRGKEYTRSELGNTGKGWILKHVDGGGGKYVRKFEDFDTLEDTVESDGNISLTGGTDWIVQPYLDHSFDFREMLCGDRVAAVELRRGNQGIFKTNLSQMEGSKSERAIRGLREGNLSVLGVDTRRLDSDLESHPKRLPRPLQNLGEDTIYALEEFTEDDINNLFVGADYMMVDRGELEGLPDENFSDRYTLGDKYIITTELNDGGGDILDRANLRTNRAANMPVLHLAHLMGNIADVPIQEPSNMSGNLESQVWRRTGMVYDNLWPSEIMAIRNRDKEHFGQLKSEVRKDMVEGREDVDEDRIDKVLDVIFNRTKQDENYDDLS